MGLSYGSESFPEGGAVHWVLLEFSPEVGAVQRVYESSSEDGAVQKVYESSPEDEAV